MNTLQYTMAMIAFSSAAALADTAPKAEGPPLPKAEYSDSFFNQICDRLKNVYKHHPDNRITLGEPIKDILANKSKSVKYQGYESHQYHFLQSTMNGHDAQYVLADEPNMTVCHITKEVYDHYKPKP